MKIPFEINPEYIAKQSRLIRNYKQLTKENLANLAGLSTSSIEKIESGKHKCNMQSLELISKGVGINVNCFKKPTPEEEASTLAQLKRAMRKTVIAKTHPIRKASDFLRIFTKWAGRRFNDGNIENDNALVIAAGINDFIDDISYVWDECGQVQRLQYAKSVVESCLELETLGYFCHMGVHKQRMRFSGKTDLVVDCGIIMILPKSDADGERYAMIELDDPWETVAHNL
ncbi:MAG: helix-turn-helix domain-containing protein [Robiginitomaculum sp.]|nr:helix-turn-helix domain-containing protein [Robiginitomaculum sp.]